LHGAVGEKNAGSQNISNQGHGQTKTRQSKPEYDVLVFTIKHAANKQGGCKHGINRRLVESTGRPIQPLWCERPMPQSAQQLSYIQVEACRSVHCQLKQKNHNME